MSNQSKTELIYRDMLLPVLLGGHTRGLWQAKALHSQYGVNVTMIGTHRPLLSFFHPYLHFIHRPSTSFDAIRVESLCRFAEQKSDYLLCLLPTSPEEASFILRNEEKLAPYFLLRAPLLEKRNPCHEKFFSLPCPEKND